MFAYSVASKQVGEFFKFAENLNFIRETEIVIKQEVHVLFVLQKQYRIKVMKSQNEYLYKVAAFSKI